MQDDNFDKVGSVPIQSQRWTSVEGSAAVASWQTSGLSQMAWCRSEGVSLHRLRYWHQRLQADRDDQPVDFIPVVGPQPSASDPIVVICGDDVRLAVSPGFDAVVLRQVMEALR